jgi:hypothetical protein
MIDFMLAVLEVSQHKAQRICAPGKWRVWRENNQIKCEIFEKAAPAA